MSAEHVRSQSSLALEEALNRPFPHGSGLLDRVHGLERQIAALDRRTAVLLRVAAGGTALACVAVVLSLLILSRGA